MTATPLAPRREDSPEPRRVPTASRTADALGPVRPSNAVLARPMVRPAPETRTRRGMPRRVKDLWERCAAAGLLVLFAPLMLAVALVVRLESPGPALFRQERVGRDGHHFTILKFRTMSHDAERLRAGLLARNDVDGGVLFKIYDDPRVTRLGRVLRRYSIDELPQLVNVLLGSMSLVGPRPALAHEVAAYAPGTRRRLAVKPGLTGLWQVSGRSDLTWEHSVRLDVAYVDNWSLRGDLRILARTFGAVLSGRGAY